MARKYTVLWLAYGNPVASRVTLASEVDPARLSQNDWLVKALVRYRKDLQQSPWSREQVRHYIEDTGPDLVAVVRGHNALCVEP